MQRQKHRDTPSVGSFSQMPAVVRAGKDSSQEAATQMHIPQAGDWNQYVGQTGIDI